MATKGNSNRTQKNGVRYALATAATVMTLLGAQSLAFAGKSSDSIQMQATQTVVALAPTSATLPQTTVDIASATAVPTDNIVATASATQATTQTSTVTATPTTVKTTTAAQITVAATQPSPTSKSSR